MEMVLCLSEPAEEDIVVFFRWKLWNAKQSHWFGEGLQVLSMEKENIICISIDGEA